MKNKLIAVTLLSMTILCSCEALEKYTGEMDVTNSRSLSYDNGYKEYITVVVDSEKIIDYEACAREIIKHCIVNDFKTIEFSYDVNGFPNELNATVYLTGKKDPIFQMTYTADSSSYNIKDNPREYSLKIKKELN